MKSIKIKNLTEADIRKIIKHKIFKVYIIDENKCEKIKYLTISKDYDVNDKNVFDMIKLTIRQNAFRLIVNKKYVSFKYGKKTFKTKIPKYINNFKDYSLFYENFILTSKKNYLFLLYYKVAHKSFDKYILKNKASGICSLIPPIE